MKGRVLVIAGSDSGGGAGIQADIKTITALGGYAMTSVTALTAQNTLGVQDIYPVPASFVRAQIDSVLTDLGADAIKTGMISTPQMVEEICAALDTYDTGFFLVVDPVMRAKGGAVLVDAETTEALRRYLLPKAHIVTPNIPEAMALTGQTLDSVDDMRRAADMILTIGPQAVLMKGGHGSGDMVTDILRTVDGSEWAFTAPRTVTRHTHGTGCTLAASISVGLAQGYTVYDAVKCGHTYVQGAIAAAPGYGSGHGPLNHTHNSI